MLTFVFIEDVIKANIHALFPDTVVKAAHLFRIIRDTDLDFDGDDEGDDLLEAVDRGLKQLRHGALAFLHVESDMPKAHPRHPGGELRGLRRGGAADQRPSPGIRRLDGDDQHPLGPT